MSRTLLDPSQVIKDGYDEAAQSHRVEITGNAPGGTPFKVEVLGSLVPQPYDEIVLTYIPSGNGAGQIGTVTYKLATVFVALLTLTYDGSNRLIDVTRT